MKAKIAITALLAAVGGGVYASSGGATPPTPFPGLQQTVTGPYSLNEFDIHARTDPPSVWRADLKVDGQSDVYHVDSKFKPGATTGWHSHPGPSFIIVVSGTVTNYESSDRTCSVNTYSAGSSFVDAGGEDVHMVKNNGAAPAETIALQVLPRGTINRRIDKPDPGTCPGE